MQNYTTAVNTIVQEIAENISSAAFDSVDENMLYITDQQDMLNFVLTQMSNFSNTAQLASAALDSGLDTVVREDLYTLIKNI